jgi:hypothetical protein
MYKKIRKLEITSSTAFSLSRSENLKALISAWASPNSRSLSAQTQTQKPRKENKHAAHPNQLEAHRIKPHSAPRTSFSSRLSSTLTGSEPCSRFMNSSASRLGLTDALLRDELFPSLNDPDTASGAGGVGVAVGSAPPLLVSGATAPPSSDNSAIADLTDSTTYESHIQMHLALRIQKLGFRIRLYIYDTDIQLYRYIYIYIYIEREREREREWA